MRINQTNVYKGPNIYANFPVIRHQIFIGILEDYSSVRLGRSFCDGLISALPGLEQHSCSYGEPGGFIRRLTEDEGTWIGHIWEHVVLEIQTLAGSDVGFGKTRSTDEAATYNMVFEYAHDEVGLEAAILGRRLLFSLMPAEIQQEVASIVEEPLDPELDWPEECEAFIRYAQRYQLGPSTAALIDAACHRDIPYLRLNDASLIQLGHGVNQRRIQATITSETRHIAVELACNKLDTNHILADVGLPVPNQGIAFSENQAADIAARIGFPVVVKPIDANHGRGITASIRSEAGVRTAFDRAWEEGREEGVLVEKHVEGDDHRMLVVGDRLVAASQRIPGHVVGDGEHTIRQLIDIVNSDPRRGVGHEKVLTKIDIDAQASRLLERSGHTLETVLPKGERCFLRSTANLSTGGTAIDVTDAVHPDNREMACRAVQAVGLDVGGVDFLTRDITRSFREVGGAIVEVNAAPGFRMHVAPSEGIPRDVAGPVIDMLYPPGTQSRIPLAAITGTNGKTTTTRMLSHLFQSVGKRVGTTTTDGVYVDGRLLVEGDMTGPISARMVLQNPAVEVGVLEVARGGILRSGLGFKWSDVAACLNVSNDHLGLRGIETLDELADVKNVVVDSARKVAVLNADDPRCLQMADTCRAEKICLVTTDPANSEVREHIHAGGLAAALEPGIAGDMITLFDGGAHLPLMWTHHIPATIEGKAVHNVKNAIFAAAMGYAMGLSLEDIRHGLRTFTTTFFQTPGRLNLYDEHPFRVILDYAHNPAAIAAMVNLVNTLDVQGERIAVIAAPGDRREQDFRELASQMAGAFDRYICKEDDDLRGREPGEVAGIIRDQLLEEGVPPETVSIIQEEVAAVREALSIARQGDLVMIFGDNVARCWQQITHPDDDINEPVEDLQTDEFELKQFAAPSAFDELPGNDSTPFRHATSDQVED